jgi:bifunctional non-homologous end joining protein LigD
MSLDVYKRKRDFSHTDEPEGKVKKSRSKQLRFVVQKHDASRLHYDFRLEVDGVLKSWAVPKGPSLNPRDKHLAIMVEDHPFSYRNFEGTIPKGNYGAGEVIVWDEGTYEPYKTTDDPNERLRYGLNKGHVHIIMHGKKLKGEFSLIKKAQADEENAWLLMKHADEYASSEEITARTESVKSGHILTRDSQQSHDLSSAPKCPLPKNVKPMLATLVDEPFDSNDWLFEVKWDGYRAIGTWDGHAATLYSRNGNDQSKKFPPVHEALRQLRKPAVLDGEVVSLDEAGKAHFEWLQNYQRTPQGRLAYYVFDLLWFDGHDLRNLPLIERKGLLASLLAGNETLLYSDHIRSAGKRFFAMAAEQQLEGIMAKRCSSLYKENYRSKQWLKIKTQLRQEVVIGGFTEPRGSRKHIGALLVGIYQKGQLHYVGHVGTGIPTEQMPALRHQLENLETESSPFETTVKANAPVHWVDPKLLAEVKFAEWTNDKHLRQPVFIGLRSDKAAEQVTEEKPMTAKLVTGSSEESRVRFTHRDKIFWAEKGYTKGDLIDYYHSVSELIMPYVKGRPHNLLRQPNGYNGKSFFQKDVVGAVPDWATTADVYSESNQKTLHYLVVNSFEDIELQIQLGCIEINPWNSRADNLLKPDWIVIDLDPEGIGFNDVIKVARVVKDVCDELGIVSYPKTSGKTGIHIFMPAGGIYSYEQVKNFAEIIANLVHSRTKETTSLERSPSKRQGKIYIDYLQNRYGQTLAAPYSVRPVETANVSTPLHWDEVNQKLDPASFTIKSAPSRFKKLGDLWQPVIGKPIDMQQIIRGLK